MTLNEWCKKNGLNSPVVTNSGAVSIICYKSDVNGFTDLWHLDDYVVSTRSGPVIWFVPKEPTGRADCRHVVGRIDWEGYDNCRPQADDQDLANSGRRVILYYNRDGAEFVIAPKGTIFAGWVIATEHRDGSGGAVTFNYNDERNCSI